MSTHTNDIKTSRITIKRPMNTNQYLSHTSTSNGLTAQLRKRTIKLNNLFNAKIKPIPSNGHSTSPPLVFHAIAPVSPEEPSKV